MQSLPTIALGLAFAILVSGCSDESTPGRSKDATTESDQAPLIVIGLDGAEWDVINELLAAGELPGFRRMMDEGAFGHLLNPGAQVSPVVWTTFATGHFSRQHGILDFVYPYTEGAKRPVDSTLRREPALWDLTNAAGKTATIIGYFVSHPAEPIQGQMVTDRAIQGLPNSVWPESLEPLAAELRTAVKEEGNELVSNFFGWNYHPDLANGPNSPTQEAALLIQGRIDNSIVTDEFLRRITLELIDEPGDLFITYFRIIDFASHSFWFYHDPTDWDVKPTREMLDLLEDSIRQSYRFADRIIEDTLQRQGGHSNIVVISDHGSGSGTGKFAPDANSSMLTGNHRPNGIFIAHGPDIKTGPVHGMTIMDVMPTLAALLELPIADTLPGDVSFEILNPEFEKRNPLTYVEAYNTEMQRGPARSVDQSSQESAMASLQGLGYIGESVQLAGGANTESYDFWNSDPKLVSINIHGEIVYYLIRNDVSAAEAVVREINRHRPEILANALARTHQKIETLRREVPGAENLAPGLEDFIAEQPR